MILSADLPSFWGSGCFRRSWSFASMSYATASSSVNLVSIKSKQLPSCTMAPTTAGLPPLPVLFCCASAH